MSAAAVLAAACSRRRRSPRSPRARSLRAARELDFGAYQQRYVALELLYLGHAYQGFARQADTEETIEVRAGGGGSGRMPAAVAESQS